MKMRMMVTVRLWFPVVMAVLFALPSAATCAQMVGTLFTGESKEFVVYDPAYRDVTAAALVGKDNLPVPNVSIKVVSRDSLTSGVRVSVTVAPKAMPGTYQLILVYGSRQALSPFVVEVRRSGPDLTVLDFNLATNVVRVANIGNQDAVFPQGGVLLSFSEPRLVGLASDQQHGRIPVGGKVTPGQIIEIKFINSPYWYCPDPNAQFQYGYYYVGRWIYALSEPRDVAGHSMLLVDPDNKIAEAYENNNTYQITRLNPYKGVIQGSGVPDLEVTRIELRKDPTRNGQSLVVYITNVASKTLYLCSYATLLRSHIDGRDLPVEHTGYYPYILQPGESRFITQFFLVDETKDQYGVSNGGLPPACHEVMFEIDPHKQIPDEISCNNVTFYYFASGSATCDPSKVMRTSKCLQPIAKQPLLPEKMESR